MTEDKRPYRMSARARAQEQTRQRIVEAAMHLHQELGPRNTTISAVAERAGVQRLTVYRHFPDETAVFQACTAHWLSLNPPPDPSDWARIDGPLDRYRSAISAFYAYYTRTQAMWRVSIRDVAEVPALQGPMAGFAGFLDQVAEDLVAAFGTRVSAGHIAPTVRHALRFPTWDDLDAQGLSDAEKVVLVTRWICCPDRES